MSKLLKSTKKLISVIIPVHNDRVGLENTLNSLKNQKHEGFNFEIIVEEDVDGKGSYFTRNKAINKSKGELLAFIDAGTLASPDWLMAGFIDLQKYDYVGGIVEIENIDHIKVSSWIYLFEQNREFAVAEFMNDLKFSPSTNLFVKRTVIEDLGAFDDRLKSSGDYEFGNRVYSSGKYLQFFDVKLKVLHGARSYSSIIKKQKRLAIGFVDLGRLYPKRFQNLKFNFLKTILKIVTPPIWLFLKTSWINLSFDKKIKVFLVTYFLSSVQNLYAIQYVLLRDRKFY